MQLYSLVSKFTFKFCAFFFKLFHAFFPLGQNLNFSLYSVKLFPFNAFKKKF